MNITWNEVGIGWVGSSYLPKMREYHRTSLSLSESWIVMTPVGLNLIPEPLVLLTFFKNLNIFLLDSSQCVTNPREISVVSFLPLMRQWVDVCQMHLQLTDLLYQIMSGVFWHSISLNVSLTWIIRITYDHFSFAFLPAKSVSKLFNHSTTSSILLDGSDKKQKKHVRNIFGMHSSKRNDPSLSKNSTCSTISGQHNCYTYTYLYIIYMYIYMYICIHILYYFTKLAKPGIKGKFQKKFWGTLCSDVTFVTFVQKWTRLQLLLSWLWLPFPPPQWLWSIRNCKHLSLPIVNYEEMDGRLDDSNQDAWEWHGEIWHFLEGLQQQLYSKQVIASRKLKADSVFLRFAPWRFWWMDLLKNCHSSSTFFRYCASSFWTSISHSSNKSPH